ncbi:MAG: LacI family DNA-binding transcriptional regulator [Clostridia bacterium]|nr:LacI family DNA-binding transcriptional regulator [Clostridia bacterium]MDY5264508.1 LacI family DNA-binding transcriptional regulator [Eubacteriales bacterium]
MAVTIKDLARETGLAYGTISAYLNDNKVREENRIKIENAIKKLGYIPNEYARALKSHTSRTIGVVIPELASFFATSIISFMEDELRKKGYGIIVCDCRSNEDIEIRSVKYLMSKMVDGLIIMPTTSDNKIFDLPKRFNVPVVVIDRYLQGDGVSSVTINNREISKIAVNNMLKNGCKNIAVIHGGEVYTSRQRLLGYYDAVGSKNDDLAVDGKFTMQGGYVAMKKLLDRNDCIDGVFVTNYDMTMGALLALKESGKVVDNDFAFTGFDLGDLTKVIGQKVQIVDQPLKEIGVNSAKILLSKINKKETNDIVLSATITNNY